MDNLGTVFFHLSGCIFYVSARTPPAGGVSHNLKFFFFVQGKGPFTVARGSQAFPPDTGVIAVTNDDADFFHY
jgi:hypothetical protein